MFTEKQVLELGRENGWKAASYAEAYENRDVQSYPPEDHEIMIPWYAEVFPDQYREAYRDGWQEFADESTDDDDAEDPWAYAEDPRER